MRKHGYQGVSLRCNIQRQQVSKRFNNQTGLPRTPAKWGVEVSTLISKSKFSNSAAVSVKFTRYCEWFAICGPSQFCRWRTNSSDSGNSPTWRLWNSIPSTLRLFNFDNSILRRLLTSHKLGLPGRKPPDHIKPTRFAFLGPNLVFQFSTLILSALR